MAGGSHDSSTICGTDLHILKGDVPETTPRTVLGHEAVGTVRSCCWGGKRDHGSNDRVAASIATGVA